MAMLLSIPAACSTHPQEEQQTPTIPSVSNGTVISVSDDTLAVNPIVIRRILNHDPMCYTQGLVLLDSMIIESSGLYGRSFLASYALGSDQYINRVELPDSLFAEGLAVVGDTIYLLTWREEICLLYSLTDFSLIGSFSYEGEGWGLAWDGSRLISSDGSEYLTFRDPRTFEPLARIAVMASGSPVRGLNELEYAAGRLYANIWTTDLIAVIDIPTGTVTALLDAAELLMEDERNGTDVLNGIAWNSSTGEFLLTGKFWPKMFIVDLELPE
jgi:glutamine cyclotransferase